jgi:hypothetical protein
MTFPAGWLTPTRIVGMSTHLFAVVTCAIAWTKYRGTPRLQRLALVLAGLEAGLFLDIVFSARWQLHNLLEDEAIRENLYAQRFGPQLAALSILGTVAAAGIGLTLLRLRGRTGAIIAVWGAVLSLSCWCAEVISLHAIDAVFHHTIGGVMLVSLCRVACSLMTSLGILWDIWSFRANNRQDANPAGKPPSVLINS